MGIRLATSDDAGWVAEIYAPYVRDTVVSFEMEPPSAEEMARRIETTLQTYPWLVAEENGQPIGYAYASQHRTRAAYRWSCDVSVYVAPTVQRRGAGMQLYVRLLDMLEGQGFRNAFAGIALPNVASIGLHERLGFEHLGTYTGVGYKFGAWHDVGWWQKCLSVSPGLPADPVPLPLFKLS